MDITQAQGTKVTKLERLIESLVGEVSKLRQELSQHDQEVEIQRSFSLVEAESQLAKKVVNAAAVEASLRNQTKESEPIVEASGHVYEGTVITRWLAKDPPLTFLICQDVGLVGRSPSPGFVVRGLFSRQTKPPPARR